MNEKTGKYEGTSFECRKAVVNDLKEAGLIDIKKHNMRLVIVNEVM